MSRERVVLGTILQDPKAILEANTLKASDFTEDKNNLIWEEAVSLYSRGNLSSRAIIENLRDKGTLGAVGTKEMQGEDYVIGVMEYADTHSFASSVEALTNAGINRELSMIAPWIKTAAMNGGNAKEIIDEAMQKLVMARRGDGVIRPIGYMVPGYREQTNRLRNNEAIDNWKPALQPMEEIFGYAEPEEYIIVAGMSGEGKSSYLRYEALQLAKNGKAVLTINGENNEYWFIRFGVAFLTGIDTRRLKHPEKLSEDEFRRQNEALEAIEKMPWFVEPMGGKKANDIEFKARQINAQQKLELVQVDQISNLTGEVSFEAFEKTSYDLREMANRLKVPVMAAHQLKDAAKGRKPEDSDMLYAGKRSAKNVWLTWEQKLDANEAALFPENIRNGRVVEDLPVRVLRFVVAKNSAGATGITSEVAWYRGLNRYNPLEEGWRSKAPRTSVTTTSFKMAPKPVKEVKSRFRA